MKKRLSRPSPAMAISMIALFAAIGGGSAFALAGKNTVDSGDIINGQVKKPDIRRNAVTGGKVKNDSIRGRDVRESTLSQVPRALNAAQLGGVPASGYITEAEIVRFRVALSFGQTVEFVSNGPVGLVADCRANIGAQGQDEIRMLAVTRQDGAFMQGDTPHSGPGVGSNHLDVATLPENRTMGGIVSTQAGEGLPAADDDIDTGFVAGPGGQYIGVDETTMYALHVGGSDCLLVGYAVIN